MAPPPPDDSVGPTVLHITLPLFGLAVAAWAVRIWSRLRPRAQNRLTAADYVVTVAVMSEAAALGLVAAAVAAGWGRHTVYLSADDQAAVKKYTYVAVLVGGCSSWGARLSITCLLLQFTMLPAWRAVVWTTMALLLAGFLAFQITVLLQCRPVSANWLDVADAQCFSAPQFSISIYASMGCAILADIVCATLPTLIIRRLSRSAVEKGLLSLLLASGLLASGAVGVRAYYQSACDFSAPDALRHEVPEYLWCRLEEIIILLAACAPLLKTPAEQLLRRLGLPTFRTPPRELNVVVSASHDDLWARVRGRTESKERRLEQGSQSPSRTRTSCSARAPT